MITFAVDENNDLMLGDDGNLSLVREAGAVRNLCTHYARALRGEMLHKVDKGIPYWKTTFGRDADIPMFEAAFRERMREVDGVEEVVSFQAAIDNNELHYIAVIRSTYGSFTLNG
ncbi:hypothetical protein [Xenorhabdus bovienii]|uniref:Phage related-protein n=1 Tax=Xenorhabdus bovienii TaxID=40576 RepID=A0AAJ1JD88_XENBV|nr:hypothetical protein [Xenorhabdus bovienii]MDE1480451.1 hypothetical protein [Xenorhabdus bovienii]MDE1487694.1 hypothetical protein [Xenorhabdus bovienii]MDE1492996.1 hypothetical protein [Xenorhabdus bovienii]MDE1497438.1 hypothetical protein [Xenorhabdus bovienii]MDE9455620.1 hypothetical protein [Xenorhabdus bovienii]